MLQRLATTVAATAAGVLLFGNPALATVPDCHGIAVADATGDQYLVVPATNAALKPTAAIDLTGVYLTGGAGAEKLNIRVADLTASPNVQYTFRWNDPVNPLGAYWELKAGFFTATGAHGPGTYTLRKVSGSSSSLFGTTGRTSPGPNGVVQLDLRWDQTAWPSTFTGLSARAEQYELNAVQDVAVRTDTATASSWSQPC